MIIALSGKAGSGKDAVAAILKQHGYQRRAFAEPLKKICADLLGVPLDRFHVPELKEQVLPGWEMEGLTARFVAQRVGTEVVRSVHPDIWVRLATKGINPHDRIVFTDCRFPNEAKAIEALGGIVCRIERPGIAPVLAHASETLLDDYPFRLYINNDETLVELQSKVRVMLEDALTILKRPST